MPIYEYECPKCGSFEHSQSISEPPLKKCPRCRSKVTKLISAAAFHLKGGGWYADGYQKKNGSAGSAKGSSPAKGATGSGSSSESSKAADSKGSTKSSSGAS